MKKTVVFLWAYSMCYDAIREHQEYDWVLIDEKGHKIREQIPDGLFSEIYFADFGNFVEVDSIFQHINKRKHIDKIITSYEEAVELAGKLRDRFGIEGAGEEVSLLFRNKDKMKSIARKSNIKTAKSMLIKSESDWKKAKESFILPYIVKPVNGCGSASTYLVKDFLETSSFRYPFQLEEYINGDEYHCDCFVQDGKVVFSSVGKYLFPMLETINGKNPTGSIIFPNSKKNEIVEEIKSLNSAVISAFGLQNGMCHAEYFERNGEIYFSEIAMRLGGGPVICPCIRHSNGVDMFKSFIEINLGCLKLDMSTAKDIYTGFICFPSKAGVITQISSAEDFNSFSNIVRLSILNKVGDTIKSQCDTTVRTGAVIVENKNYDKLKEELFAIYKSFKLTTE